MESNKNRFGIDWSKVQGTQFWRRPQLNRRMFFRNAATAVGGYWLMPGRPMETVAKGAGTPIGTAKNCIFILLAGAPSHTDTFDLKEGPWTPAFFNPTSYGDIRFPQGLMPKLAGQMDSIALVRSVRAWATAHGIAQDWLQIGRNPVSGLSKIAPHIGSVVSVELSSSSRQHVLPTFISLNTGQGRGEGYLPPENAPFYVSPNGGGLPNTRHPDGPDALDRRYGMLQDIDAEWRSTPARGGNTDEVVKFNIAARQLMYNGDVDKIFNFDQNTRNAYGNTSFGNACVTARNLLRADMGTRFIQITLGGWDHHVNIYQPNTNLQAMTKQLDAGLGQLMQDLKDDGTFDQTLFVVVGEFGRTVGALNQTNGRDHHPQQSALLAGAKISGGKAIGVTDSLGAAINDPGWSAQREVRAEDLEATIYSALGIDWTKIRRDDPFGRGFEYVPQTGPVQYYPINELWQ